MGNYIKIAKKYSRSGYSVIPVTSEKVPAIRDWSTFQVRTMTEVECEKYFKDCFGIALLCGGSKGVTGLDFDIKYDLTGDLFERFKEEVPKKLLKKMYVQSTKNGGYHMLFSCSKVEPNQKLASRYTTCYEKDWTYKEAFKKEETRDIALKIAINDKSRVLIETRGGKEKVSGGYVLMAPTPGYEKLYGSIEEITEEEYDILLSTARLFNEVIEVKKDPKKEKYKTDWVISPFEDYNERGDILQILYQNGWEEVSSAGNSVRLKRPGGSASKSSALFDIETRIFNCFSTSTLFDVSRGYTPTDVFAELECNGDLSMAFRKLIDLDYGEKEEE